MSARPRAAAHERIEGAYHFATPPWTMVVEPGSLALLSLGSLVLALRRR